MKLAKIPVNVIRRLIQQKEGLKLDIDASGKDEARIIRRLIQQKEGLKLHIRIAQTRIQKANPEKVGLKHLIWFLASSLD